MVESATVVWMANSGSVDAAGLCPIAHRLTLRNGG
jgi:hypothetical protein